MSNHAHVGFSDRERRGDLGVGELVAERQADHVAIGKRTHRRQEAPAQLAFGIAFAPENARRTTGRSALA